MTICVAGICENKYVVLITDRMVTVSPPNIEYEAPFPKAKQITKNCMFASAGSALAITPIVQEVGNAIVTNPTKEIDKIVEFTRTAYLNARNKKLEEEVLFPFGITLQNFYQAQQGLNANLVNVIIQNMAKYDYRLSMIIAGVDEKGCHIYRMENPGKVFNFDSIGYLAVGSGEIHATSAFIANNHASDVSLNKGLAIAFEAKKRSEKAPGVGLETDMYVVTKDNIIHLPQSVVTELESMYQKKLEQERKATSEVEGMISKLDIMKYVNPTPDPAPQIQKP